MMPDDRLIQQERRVSGEKRAVVAGADTTARDGSDRRKGSII